MCTNAHQASTEKSRPTKISHFLLENWAQRGTTDPVKRESYDAEIKVRVPRWLKKNFEAQATRDDLELSDIVRKALKEFALKGPSTTHRELAVA